MNCHWLQPVDKKINNNWALAKSLNNNKFNIAVIILAKAKLAFKSYLSSS